MAWLVPVLGFASGIALESVLAFGWTFAGLALLIAVSAGLLRLQSPGRGMCLVVSIFFLAASLGVTRVVLAPHALPPALVPFLDTTVELEGKVVADPDVRETSQRITVLVRKDGASTRVLAVIGLFPEPAFGETVRIRGTLSLPEPFDTANGRSFRYDRYLAKDGVFAVVKNASLEILAPRRGALDTVRGWFSDLKSAGVGALGRALPEPQASLASGLLLGGKQGLGTRLLDDFVRSGLVHIVVLSGYNVMIVAEAVLRAFGFLARRYAAAAAGAVIAAFVLMAGAGSASVRAGLMAGLALFGRATGRTYDATRALVAAGLLMLLVNPLLLAYDPGFQLSFVATLGLIFLSPLVEPRLAFVKSAFVREIMASTIAAQIAVLPLLLYQNGLFSVVALPANLLVLPVVPAAMAFSAVAGLAGFLVPTFAPIAGFPAYVLLSYITGVVGFASSLPLAAFSIPAFPFWIVVLLYGALFWAVRRERRKLKRPSPKSVFPARSS